MYYNGHYNVLWSAGWHAQAEIKQGKLVLLAQLEWLVWGRSVFEKIVHIFSSEAANVL